MFGIQHTTVWRDQVAHVRLARSLATDWFGLFVAMGLLAAGMLHTFGGPGSIEPEATWDEIGCMFVVQSSWEERSGVAVTPGWWRARRWANLRFDVRERGVWPSSFSESERACVLWLAHEILTPLDRRRCVDEVQTALQEVPLTKAPMTPENHRIWKADFANGRQYFPPDPLPLARHRPNRIELDRIRFGPHRYAGLFWFPLLFGWLLHRQRQFGRPVEVVVRPGYLKLDQRCFKSGEIASLRVQRGRLEVRLHAGGCVRSRPVQPIPGPLLDLLRCSVTPVEWLAHQVEARSALSKVRERAG